MSHPLVLILIAPLLFLSIGCNAAGGEATRAKQPATAATQPAAGDQRAAPEPTPLFDRLGGVEGIGRIVDDLIALSLADQQVNFTRAGHARTWSPTERNLAVLHKRLVDFIATNTGGALNYRGADMLTAHAGMGISGAEFDAFAANLKQAMAQNEVAEPDQAELLAIVSTTRSVIVEEQAGE